MFRSSWRGISHLAARAGEAAQSGSAGASCLHGQTFLTAVHKF